MAKFSLTEAQERAATKRNCDLLVSAAAGSGKTAVLSERILKAVMNDENPQAVTDFLVVTFTNAAAAEMKKRIGENIMKAYSEGDNSPQMKKHLRKQISLMSKANVTTIHSFCLDIIKNNFHFIDIDPDVRIADGNEMEILKMQVAMDTLEEMYSSDGKMFSEVCLWIGGGRDEELIVKIIELYKFIRSFSNPFSWLRDKVEEYNPKSYKCAENIPWISLAKYHAKESIELKVFKTKEIRDNLIKNGIIPYAETATEDIGVLNKYIQVLEREDMSYLVETPVFPKLNKKTSDDDEVLCEEFKKNRTTLKKKINELVSTISVEPEELLRQMKNIYPRLKCFEKTIETFDRLFKEKKKKLSIIEFSDFEHYALEILSDSSNGVAEGLKNKYSEIMIDEYQDCNQIQEEIFSYISKKVDGVSSNMFMVGDIKQSIYGFRQADPEIFADKNKRYTDDGICQKVVLNENFRSTDTILKGINSVFEKIMTESTGGVLYSDDEKLNFPKAKEQDIGEKCEFVGVDNSDSKNAQAEYIAERIISLVENGYKFSDITILSRGLKSTLGNIEEALKSRNIPYYSDGGSGFMNSLEITVLTTLLKVIDNPMQDIELVGLLRGPVFGFNDNLLSEIRLEVSGPFYNALLKYSCKETEGGLKCREFLNRLSMWRDKVLFMPVDEFIEYLIEDTAIDAFAVSLPGGEQRKANLKLFVMQARQLQNSGFKGLFSFVSYIDRLSLGSESIEAKMLSENSNVVRILTIHKSKGLEFPVVFVYGCDKGFGTMDIKKNFIYHKIAGIGIKFTDAKRKIKYPVLTFHNVKGSITKDNLSEEMRVLYVALTRAKKKLICTGNIVKSKISNQPKLSKGKNTELLAKAATCFFDWIRLGFDENWEVSYISSKDIAKRRYAGEENADIPIAKEDFDVTERLEKKYLYDVATRLPTKISVSEIKKKNQYESPEETKLYIPEVSEMPSFMTEEKLSPAQKGIINHLVLKHIDIASADVEKCISMLISKNLFSEEETKAVDKAGIKEFFESEIGQRVKKSNKVLRELSFEIDVDADELFDDSKFGGEKILLQGIVDLVFEENGGLILLDYKTDKFLDKKKKEMYFLQLELYTKAVEKITGKKVIEKYLYMLNKKEFIKI